MYLSIQSEKYISDYFCSISHLSRLEPVPDYSTMALMWKCTPILAENIATYFVCKLINYCMSSIVSTILKVSNNHDVFSLQQDKSFCQRVLQNVIWERGNWIKKMKLAIEARRGIYIDLQIGHSIEKRECIAGRPTSPLKSYVKNLFAGFFEIQLFGFRICCSSIAFVRQV